jgi:hypothetical protein
VQTPSQAIPDIQEHVDDLVNGRAPGPFGRHDERGGAGRPGMPPMGGFPDHP